jgi:hypothetical protein
MLVAIMNSTLIKPAPTLSSKAPANGAPKMKKITAKKTLPSPMALMITINRRAINTKMDVSRKHTVNRKIAQAVAVKPAPPFLEHKS